MIPATVKIPGTHIKKSLAMVPTVVEHRRITVFATSNYCTDISQKMKKGSFCLIEVHLQMATYEH